MDGRLKVVTETTPWAGGLVGINSFGFGGANTHILLKSIDMETLPPDEIRMPNIPKLLCYSGRTEDAVGTILEAAEKHADNHYFYGLLSEQSNSLVNLFPYRGYTIMHRDIDQPPLREVQVTK